MRKDFKSKSKKKWITGGILLFGGIALLTTGFATWVVGVNKTKEDKDHTIVVEGTESDSFALYVTLKEDKFNVGENHTRKPDEIFGSKDEGHTDFTFQAEFKIEVGKSSLYLPDKISFDFHYFTAGTDKDETKDNFKTTDNNKFTIKGDTTDIAGINATGLHSLNTELTYLDINEASTLTVDTDGAFETTGWKRTETTSTLTFTATKTVEVLKWGSYFENKSPATYYNEKYKSGAITGSAENINNMTTETKLMKSRFEEGTKKIVITSIVSTKANSI